MFDSFSDSENSPDRANTADDFSQETVLDETHLLLQFRTELKYFVDQLAGGKSKDYLREERKDLLIKLIQLYPREVNMLNILISDGLTDKIRSARREEIRKINFRTATFLSRNGIKDEHYGVYVESLINLYIEDNVKYVSLNIAVVQDIITVLNKSKFNTARRSR